LSKQLEENAQLLAAIKRRLPELEKLLDDQQGMWAFEDLAYRFYHQSYKVFGLQDRTNQILNALQSLVPGLEVKNEWFLQIVTEGTGRKFDSSSTNRNWLAETRPILEAYSHALYFLAMVCKYGRELDEAPSMLPSGWAAVLYLYGMR
jgi:hypothetical protein